MQETFVVKRRILTMSGWTLIGLCVVGLLIMAPLTRDISPLQFRAGIACFPIGIIMVLAAKNVTQIKIDDEKISFAPVGADVCFAEITGINIPGWVDRRDNPPNTIASIVLETASNTTRFVPGAILQSKGRCQLYVYGCDSDRLLKLLRQRIPAV